MSDYEEGRRKAREERYTTNPNELGLAEKQGYDDEVEEQDKPMSLSSSSSSSSSSVGSNPIALSMAIAAALHAMAHALDAETVKAKLAAMFISLETVFLTIFLARALWDIGWGLAIIIGGLAGFSYFLANKARTWGWILGGVVVTGWLSLILFGQPILGLCIAVLSAWTHYLFIDENLRSLVICRVGIICQNTEASEGQSAKGEYTKGITLTIEDGKKTRTIVADDRGYFSLKGNRANIKYEVSKICLKVEDGKNSIDACMEPKGLKIRPYEGMVLNQGKIAAVWDKKKNDAKWTFTNDGATESIFMESGEYKSWKHNGIVKA